MDYELAKELKDAGFRFSERDEDEYGDFYKDEDDGVFYHYPTLSELIEACGEDLSAMLFIDNKWVVGRQGMPFSYLSEQHTQAKGATLEEAVSKLWLTLNKVDTNKNT